MHGLATAPVALGQDTPLQRHVMAARSPIAALLVALALIAAFPAGASGQARRDLRLDGQQQQIRRDLLREVQFDMQPGLERAPMLVETSPELMNLIDRAQDAAGRNDWKVAVDSLQRVIDDATGALLPCEDGAAPGGVLYESARRYARRLLRELPPEGRRAYRLVNDGRARGIVERARQDHDLAALRGVVDRYLLTSVGDNAADLLSSWLLDSGRAGEALPVLMDLIDFCDDHDVPQERVVAKLAAANALLGRNDDAASVLNDYRAQVDPNNAAVTWMSQVVSVVAARDLQSSGSAFGSYRAAPLTVNQSPQPLNPRLMENPPWVYELPGGVENIWQRIFENEDAAPALLGLAELVSDGRRLFVRKRGGCAALQPDDLMPIWETAVSTGSEAARQARPVDVQRLLGMSSPQQYFEDDPGKLISTAAGLVFVIESSGAGEYRGNDLLPAEASEAQPETVPPARINVNALAASRLVAVDAATGAIRWQRGRTGQPADVLGDVHFMSVPIAVGDFVWVPYQRRKDFAIAVLRPSDGAVVQSVLLGSAAELNPTRRVAAPLGYGDGVVYVPSGYGMLFAVDASDFSLRWAVQYSPATSVDRRVPAAGWMPTAPVAVGGLVLLAPTDHSELLAFSSSDGQFAWSIPAEQNSYILAARPDRFWLAGRGLACRLVQDGGVVWKADVANVPTGRAVLVQDRILVPTSTGLASLSADSGELLSSDALGPNDMPLGNLLSLDTAIFSLNTTSVRRYTDIERGRAAAIARFEADPLDVRAATQLAWAELLSANPSRAAEVTERFAHLLEEPNAAANSLRRVRLESLLSLATTAPTGAASLDFLREAESVARHAEQNTRVQLAIAEQLQSLGRSLEAHAALFNLGMLADADRTVFTRDAVSVSVRFDVSRRLKELCAAMTESDRAAVDAELSRRVADTLQRLQQDDSSARRELLFIADLDPTGAGGQRALFAVARREIDRLRFEWAEQFLHECIQRDVDPEVTLAAYISLCDMYAPDRQNAPGMLAECLDDIQQRFGQQPLPPDPISDEVVAADEPAGSVSLVAEWAASRRAALPAEWRSAPRAGDVGGEPVRQLTGDRLWSYGFDTNLVPPRLVEFGGQWSPAIADSVLLFGTDDALESLDAGMTAVADSKPHMLWRTEMRLPGTLDGPRVRVFRERQAPRRAVIDGQIGVFNATDGMFGVGLITGRRLWARGYDSPLDTDLVPYRDTLMDAADGVLAAMPRAGRLTLMRMVDGATVWERDLRGEPVSHIWIEGDRVMTADASKQRVHLFDRADGREVGKIFFRQPNAESGLVHLVSMDGVLCGPEASGSGDSLVGISLATGEQLWRLSLDRPIAQIFSPGEGRIGAGLLGGGIRLIEPRTGEVLLERHFSKGLPVVDATMVDGTLIAQAERRHGQLRVPELVAIDIATGEEVWARADLASLQEPPGPLVVTGGAIPALVDGARATVNAAGAPGPRNFIGLTMINVKNGQVAGTLIDDLPAASTGVRMTRDLAVRAGLVVIGSNRGLYAYRLATEAAPGNGS